ncbi:DMT family transporter [Aestuariirhabdus litorea]|uniref:DMT family transporter n=1 Tax=Aestuariirhabdus litorea TaxID=2528527 RepID=A0A3P3VRM0_9GAMM|nr:DMT family transporter [Aestuariirhabdus litorea]RRJ84336.1 DMT family transporter [Aestuariirhabdus litorea]RWW97559.1 DMT family transporter [Endozoicomonadaceae bacterium GTF-13]
MHSTRSGLISLHAGCLLLGGTALFSKLLEMPALDITLWRSLIAAFALALFVLARGGSLLLGRRFDYAIILMLGVLLAVHWVTYFHAMQVSTIAIGVIAFFSHPVISVLLEAMAERRKPSPRDFGCAAWVVAGVAIMVPTADGGDIASGVGWGLFSALLFSLRNIAYKRYCSHYNSSLAMMYQCLVVGLVLLPFGGSAIASLGVEGWSLLLVLGAIFTATPHTLFSVSLRLLPVGTASLIMCTVPLYAVLLAALLLGEVPGLQTLVGGAMVLAAASYESLRTSRRLMAQLRHK